MTRARLPAEAVFIDAAPGRRFGLYHAPQPHRPCRGALLYVHPYGDEMNRTRQLAAQQARALSDLGYGVLAIDLFGCGDSTGDAGEADWAQWKADLACAARWLEARLAAPLGLFGLRLGASLALDFACELAQRAPDESGAALAPSISGPLILWQPVISGKTFLTQVLRQRVAADLFGDGRKSDGPQALRAALQAGQGVEVAGYEISPALAAALDALDLHALRVPALPLHWIELVGTAAPAEGAAAPPSAGAALVAGWRAQGVPAAHHALAGAPFWATAEPVACPQLLAHTSALLAGAA